MLYRRSGVLVLLCCAAALVVSCHRRAKQAAAPLPAPTSPAPVLVPPPLPPPLAPVAPAPNLIPPAYRTAEQAFEAGRYLEAAKAYESYLRLNDPDNQDRVHFRLGLSYSLLPDSPQQNLKNARTHFQRLVKEFPDSPYRAPADLILSLLATIDKLSANIREIGANNRELNAAVKDQQGKIKQLSEELQRLKAIDMKRSPSRPPR
jgi:tetratricopeptide (TPR) repeat protein